MIDSRLGCSTISFRHLPLPQALATIAELGFAEIDFGEPECPDPAECGFEGEVSKADGRAAEAAVNHFQVLASSVVTTTTLTQSTVNSQLIAESLCRLLTLCVRLVTLGDLAHC